MNKLHAVTAITVLSALWLTVTGYGSETIKLYNGFVSKISCKGKLLISAIGNDQLVKLEALPKELGCGVILKPSQSKGETNLILETSTGSLKASIKVLLGFPSLSALEINLNTQDDEVVK